MDGLADGLTARLSDQNSHQSKKNNKYISNISFQAPFIFTDIGKGKPQFYLHYIKSENKSIASKLFMSWLRFPKIFLRNREKWRGPRFGMATLYFKVSDFFSVSAAFPRSSGSFLKFIASHFSLRLFSRHKLLPPENYCLENNAMNINLFELPST